MISTPDNHPFQSLQSEKFSEQISRQLLQKIVEGHYKPGDRLPAERDLATIFNVSRVVVRESISSLEAKGIINVRQGRGTTVNSIDEWNTLDPQVLLLLHGDEIFDQLMETRRIIEPDLAALAAERITAAELELLRASSNLPKDDSIEEHVELAAAGQKVLGLVRNHVVGAERAHQLEIALAAHRRDLGRAQRLGDLHREGTDCPGGAVDQHPLARLDLTLVTQPL